MLVAVQIVIGQFWDIFAKFPDMLRKTTFNLRHMVNVWRIEKAKLLHETTDAPIQAIADQLGFCDMAYFYKTFQKYVGLTPKQYREENKSYF